MGADICVDLDGDELRLDAGSTIDTDSFLIEVS